MRPHSYDLHLLILLLLLLLSIVRQESATSAAKYYEVLKKSYPNGICDFLVVNPTERFSAWLRRKPQIGILGPVKIPEELCVFCFKHIGNVP